LPVSFYYSVDCNAQSETSINDIKDQIFALLEDYIGSAFAPDCLAGSTCSYDDLVVQCGSTSKRKKKDIHDYRFKREVSELFVNFSLIITGTVSNWDELLMYEDFLFQMSDQLKNAVSAGQFDLNDLAVVRGSFFREQISSTKCEGSGQVQSGFQCSKI
jgi:hypothetical protein